TSCMGYARMMRLMPEMFHEEERIPSGEAERLYRMVQRAVGGRVHRSVIAAMHEPFSGFVPDSIADAFWKLEWAFRRCSEHLGALLDQEATLSEAQKESIIKQKFIALKRALG